MIHRQVLAEQAGCHSWAHDPDVDFAGRGSGLADTGSVGLEAGIGFVVGGAAEEHSLLDFGFESSVLHKLGSGFADFAGVAEDGKVFQFQVHPKSHKDYYCVHFLLSS